jgi:hypothetical protein
MTSIVPVPQKIASLPVVAAMAVAARPSELPWQFIVICQQDRTAPGTGPYVTWRVGSRDGREWAAENGCYDLTWPKRSPASPAAPACPPPPAHTGLAVRRVARACLCGAVVLHGTR